MTIKERIERQRRIDELFERFFSAKASWAKLAIAELIISELKKK